MTRGRNALASWLLTIAFSYLFLSEFLGHRIEGQIATTSELGLAALVLLSAGISIVLTVRATGGSSDPEARVTAASPRRRFLFSVLGVGGGLATTLAAAIIPNRRWGSVTVKNIFAVRPPYMADVARDEWAGSRVTGYRRLGRTEAFVSDISMGSGSSTGGRQTLQVAREAIDRGINYFDTAPDYSEAGSENRLGEAMLGQRDKMFVATKFCLPHGHLGPGTSVEGYMKAVEGSLERLQTDWVDLVHIHSCNSVDRLLDENVHEAFDRLKQQGKVRFLGVSTHTPNLEEVANAAIESDRFDVMMLAYHFGAWPGLSDIIDRAAAKDIGIVGMKVLRGSQHHFLDWSPDDRDSFTQASFKWVLENPSVSCLVISLWETGQLDEFLYASGQTLRPQDVAVLERYQQLTAASHCRPHCGVCLDNCSEGLPIHDVLRHRMYFENYGAQKEAMRLYSALEKKADICSGCAAPCTNACPDGIAIPERMRGAHELLSMNPGHPLG
jgi:predicted aldo/keto reductase-like oxidoreductase